MADYLRVDPDTSLAVEAWSAPEDKTPADCFTAELAADFHLAGTADVGWKWDGAKFVAVTDAAPSITDLIAYAEAKQIVVLETLKTSYQLADGTATLDTMCGEKSRSFLWWLAAWATDMKGANPAPTRVYYNLDGSSHQITPAQVSEFLHAVGLRIQATFDAVATIRLAIAAKPPTPRIVSFAQIDAFDWPTS